MGSAGPGGNLRLAHFLTSFYLLLFISPFYWALADGRGGDGGFHGSTDLIPVIVICFNYLISYDRYVCPLGYVHVCKCAITCCVRSFSG